MSSVREDVGGWLRLGVAAVSLAVVPIWLLATAALVQERPDAYRWTFAGRLWVLEEPSTFLVWVVGAAQAGVLVAALSVVPLFGWSMISLSGRFTAWRDRRARIRFDRLVDVDAVLTNVALVVRSEASFDPRVDAPSGALATPWRRVQARLVDGAVGVAIFCSPLFAIVPDLWLNPERPEPGVVSMVAAAIGVVLFAGLAIVQVTGLTRDGQTIGKAWVGVRVMRVDGSPAGFVGAVLLRQIAFGSLLGLPIVGFLLTIVEWISLFGSDGRTVRDRLAGTVVVEA